MIAPSLRSPGLESMVDWRRQVGRSGGRTSPVAVRPFAIVSYSFRRKPRQWPLVDLRDVTLLALFDEQQPSGRLATRLVGISGHLINQGLDFGGPEHCRFDKDLRLRPVAGGRGASFDPARGELLAVALQLDRYLERYARYPYFPRRSIPKLPALVSSEHQGRATLVDFSWVRKRQVITYASPDNLRGISGNTSFDFYHTRFQRDR